MCRKSGVILSLDMHGEWEHEVVATCVAVCGEEQAAQKILNALVTTLKPSEASAARHSLSQHPGTIVPSTVCARGPDVTHTAGMHRCCTLPFPSFSQERQSCRCAAVSELSH